MKKNILLIISLAVTFLLVGCGSVKENDAEQFSKEYTEVGEYNYFVYKDSKEIVKILENGTGVVYLGFPECPWCQAYVPMLNEVADTEGLEKIYYFNILEERNNNTEEYKKMVEILKEHLPFDDEGNKRIYVPAVIFVSKGEIVGFDDETAYDTKGLHNPEEYWTEAEVTDLKKKLTNYMSKVIDNQCTDCNK